MTRDKHFTKPPPRAKGKTKIVRGAPVKITRARDGSLGKSTKEELVPAPDTNWLDPKELEVFAHQKASDRQSFVGEWIGSVGKKLDQIEESEGPEKLPEFLADEEEVIRNTAEEKLRELQKGPGLDKENNEDALQEKKKSRFDSIELEE